MARDRRKLTPEERRQRRLAGQEFREAYGLAGWQIEWVNPAIGRTVDGAKITEWIEDESHDLDQRWFGYENGTYDETAWISAAKWDAAVDNGARMLRCGHCGSSTSFNVRDQVDVLCEGCGTTYMTTE